jgi:DNA-binding NarL/FixJ family response regulator
MPETSAPGSLPAERPAFAPTAQPLSAAFQAFEAGHWAAAVAGFEQARQEGSAFSGETWHALGTSLFMVGSTREAVHAYEQAFAAFTGDRSAEAVRRAVRTAIQLVGLHLVLGEPSAVQGWEQRARRACAPLGECIERGYLAVARVACDIHDPVELYDNATLALALAREFGDHDLELRALADQGLALISQGSVTEGLAQLDEVMVAVAAGEMANPEERAKAMCAMFSACERTGDLERADYWRGRIEGEPQLHDSILDVHCSMTLGVLDALTGRWGSAEARLTNVMTGSHGVGYYRPGAAARLAELRIRQGRYDEAATLLAGYQDRFEVWPTLAHLRFVEGNYEQAAALLDLTARSLGHDCLRMAPVLSLLVETELSRGDLAAAQGAAARLSAIEAHCESNEIRALDRLARARIARRQGNLPLATELLKTALVLLIHYDRPLLTAQVRLDLAQVLAESGHTSAASMEAGAALATFQRLGVVDKIQAAEALHQRLQPAGAERGAAEPAATAALSIAANRTHREREVAALVADGLTNREIADQLVLSVRTVETHVDRILGKLDLHTRTQLAARIAGERRS